MVYVVDDGKIRDFDDLAVPFDGEIFFICGISDFSLSIVGESALVGVPLAKAEARVVIGVNDSVAPVFLLSQE